MQILLPYSPRLKAILSGQVWAIVYSNSTEIKLIDSDSNLFSEGSPQRGVWFIELRDPSLGILAQRSQLFCHSNPNEDSLPGSLRISAHCWAISAAHVGMRGGKAVSTARAGLLSFGQAKETMCVVEVILSRIGIK